MTLRLPTAPIAQSVAGVSIAVDDAYRTIDGAAVVRGVSFEARPGEVTALLGPNGAGKSTVLRSILGLVRLDSGVALVGDRPVWTYDRPSTVAGVLLDPDAVDGGRTALAHLRILAASTGLPASSVTRALRLVGLGHHGRVKVANMSLGMRQRLALAAAFIGDPAVLILDEPHNGLDASAIRWLRSALRAYADAGRTVLLSSHLLAEVARLADRVVVIADGEVLADEVLTDFVGTATDPVAALERRYLAMVGDR